MPIELSGTNEPDPGAERKRPRKVALIIAAVAVLTLGGAAYAFLPSLTGGASATAPAPKAVPGTVLPIDAISVNLAGGHYLRLGLSLQLTAEVVEAPSPARALDAAIAEFSGHTVAEVSSPATRDALKAHLLVNLEKAYGGEVMDVYLTDYVTQ